MAHLKLEIGDEALVPCGNGCNGTGAIEGLVCDYCAGTGKKLKTYNIAQLKSIIEKIRYTVWIENQPTNPGAPQRTVTADEAIMRIANLIGFEQKGDNDGRLERTRDTSTPDE